MGQGVLGLPVEEAEARLAEHGLPLIEVVTAPPRRQLESGVWRVVQQRKTAEGGMTLVVARFPVLAVCKA